MRRITLLVVGFAALAAASVWAGERVPGEHWMSYARVEDAGFDAAKLEEAHATWQDLPSSAFMVVADGAVVAAWGDVERRFMCHSVRKSFLSALFGIYWDRGEIDLNKTLADLGLDDEPDPLLDTEKRARILDLLKARSGVFHPAAYAGRTDSAPRGSKGPGRYFAYNNWDFNTLAAILEMETGARVFEAFDTHFGQPLGMQDWRISDGYYHYERDKSKYPAYPFRLSTRDAARFGLLFARDGVWDDTRIVSSHWVRRSTALYSIDDDVRGYGFMWWVFREPRFEKHGMVAALGVGNQMIAVLPRSGLVIVNRANTYESEFTPAPRLLDLVEQILAARTLEPAAQPTLVPLEGAAPDARLTSVPNESLREFVGTWAYPPAPLGLPPITETTVTVGEGHVVAFSPLAGTFRMYVQPDGSLFAEDSERRYTPIRDTAGGFAGFADDATIVNAAVAAAGQDNHPRAAELVALVEEGGTGVRVVAGRALIELLGGRAEDAERSLRQLATHENPRSVERTVNGYGYGLLQVGKPARALDVFALNTRVFPEAANTWDSLGEAHMVLGQDEDAIRCYERSLELNENNNNAKEKIAKIREKMAER